MPNEIIPQSLLDAVIMQESSNNPNAYNKKSGAKGLMQITPITLADYNLENETDYLENSLFNPEVNKQIGKWYLYERIPQMLKTYKIPLTIDNILIAYNFGIGNLKRGKSLPEETLNYIKNIKNYLEKNK